MYLSLSKQKKSPGTRNEVATAGPHSHLKGQELKPQTEHSRNPEVEYKAGNQEGAILSVKRDAQHRLYIEKRYA